MSYNCSDFVQDCELNADLYKAPQVDYADLENCDPQFEGDSLRVLAERVARAMSERYEFLKALRGLTLHCLCDVHNPCWDNRPTDRIGRHWGGGLACPPCIARAVRAQAVL